MSDRSPLPAEVVHVPFNGGHIPAVDVDGAPHVILKPVVESIGIDYWTQVEKLRRKSWACTGQRLVQLPGDTQRRAVVTVDVRTLIMLLATVDEHRVSEEARDTLIAYQAKSAKALEDYWTGGARVPDPRRELSNRELAVMVIAEADRADEEARQRAIEAEGRAVAEHKVAELAPAAHSWTTLAEAHGDFSVADAAKILANDPAIDMGRDRLYDLLGELGWTFRSGDKGRWQPYQREIERGRLRTRFRSYDHPTTGKRVTASPDIRLTVKAIQWLHTHLGGTGEVQFPAEQLTIPGGAA